MDVCMNGKYVRMELCIHSTYICVCIYVRHYVHMHRRLAGLTVAA